MPFKSTLQAALTSCFCPPLLRFSTFAASRKFSDASRSGTVIVWVKSFAGSSFGAFTSVVVATPSSVVEVMVSFVSVSRSSDTRASPRSSAVRTASVASRRARSCSRSM